MKYNIKQVRLSKHQKKSRIINFRRNITKKKPTDPAYENQKNPKFTSLGYLKASVLSKTQTCFPDTSIWFHHLIPTRNLPVTFLTVQKSKQVIRRTIMKVKIEPPPIRYSKIK